MSCLSFPHMELWLDSVDDSSVRFANQLGILTGVTSNPSILATAGRPRNELIARVLSTQAGPMAVQVLAERYPDIIAEAEELHTISSRIIVKIPVTREGIRAIRTLELKGISTMATALFHTRQYLLVALAGASYSAPYVGLMQAEAAEDPLIILQQMRKMKQNYGLSTKILGAALRDIGQILRCAELGIDAVTCKADLFAEFTSDASATLQRMRRFAADWAASSM